MKNSITVKQLIIGGAVIIAIIGVVIWSNRGKTSFVSAMVVNGEVIQNISVTGKVAPEEKADLSFEKSGTISNIYVKVGDIVKKGQVLGSIDSGEISASLQSAQANAVAEEAKLEELYKGTRSEELVLSELSYKNAETSLVNTTRDVFVKMDDAIRIKIDTMFTNGGSVVPDFIPRTQSNLQKKTIEDKRLFISEAFKKWRDSYIHNPDTEAVSMITKKTLDTARSLLDDIATVMSEATTPTAAGLSQADIDQYKSTLNLAFAELTTANTNFIASQSAYETARDELALKKAGATAESIKNQTARLAQARATALNLEATLRKTSILSPLDGVVTIVKPTVGELVTPEQIVFSVMSKDTFKIEVFVPESDISKIHIGNTADVNLDAYGKDTFFTAEVTLIDPAETIVEGVPTYKVTLSVMSDPRIRSGMTADIHVLTAQKKSVLVVPIRALTEKDGKTFVQKVEGSSVIETQVEIGLKGSNGNVEIIQGLNLGEHVRIN